MGRSARLLLVACVCVASCKRAAITDALADDVVCEGDHAWIRVDGGRAVQRCKSGCETKPHFRCETVDDPRVGEACYDERLATEGYTSSPIVSRCSQDKKTLLACNPSHRDQWHVSSECPTSCEGHACR